MDILTLHGTEATPFLPHLARLRIQVFREFPYLYDGSLDYEQRYLNDYFSSPESVLVIAREPHNHTIVGASTAMPLPLADTAFKQPFHSNDLNINEIHYFGESVLLPKYRGHGIGHRFFDARENAARTAGFSITAFCAVERETDHPQRPLQERSLASFWKRRGYTHHPDIHCSLDWKEPDTESEVPHKLSFWIRNLNQSID